MTPLNAIKYLAWDAFFVAARKIDGQISSEDFNQSHDFRYAGTTSGADVIALEKSKTNFFTTFLLEEHRLDQPDLIADYVDTWILSRDFEQAGFMTRLRPPLHQDAERAINDWQLDRDLQLAEHAYPKTIKYDYRILGYTQARIEGLRIEAAKARNPDLHLPHITEEDLKPENYRLAFYEAMLDGIQRVSPQMALEMDSMPYRLHNNDLEELTIPDAASPALPSRRWG